MRHDLRPLTIALVLTFAAACGSKSNDHSSGSALDGTWITNCRESVGSGIRQTYFFDGSSYTFTHELFDDPTTCVSPLYKVVTAGSFKTGDLTDDDTGAREIDFAQTSSLLTAQSASAVTSLAGTCDIDTWTVNTATSILGRDGCGAAFDTFAARRLYDIYKITGGTQLNFGSEGSGDLTAAATRPTTLDDQATYASSETTGVALAAIFRSVQD